MLYQFHNNNNYCISSRFASLSVFSFVMSIFPILSKIATQAFHQNFLRFQAETHLLTHSIEAHKTQCTLYSTLQYAMQYQCISWSITIDLLQGSDSPCWPKIGIFASSQSGLLRFREQKTLINDYVELELTTLCITFTNPCVCLVYYTDGNMSFQISLLHNLPQLQQWQRRCLYWVIS